MVRRGKEKERGRLTSGGVDLASAMRGRPGCQTSWQNVRSLQRNIRSKGVSMAGYSSSVVRHSLTLEPEPMGARRPRRKKSQLQNPSYVSVHGDCIW